MTLSVADRVLQTTMTAGTGTLSLDPGPTGYISFIAGVGTGKLVPYHISDATDFESGIGTITAGSPDTLTRDIPLRSSNGGARVNFGGNQKMVRLAPLSDVNAIRDENLNLIDGFGTSGGTGNAHTVTLTPAPKGYSNGMLVAYFAPAANTGNVTANVNGLGAKGVLINGREIPPGGIPSGALVVGRYKTSSGKIELIHDPLQASQAQATIASAATTSIGTATSRNLVISGTTGITSFGNSGTAGQVYRIRFSGNLLLTNSASLVLPGGVNMNVVAGDIIEAEDMGGNVWRVRRTPSVTPWKAYTPVFTGFGTVTNIAFFSRRVGDTLEIRGNFTTGTTTATEARLSFGFDGTEGGLLTETTKLPTGVSLAGEAGLAAAGAFAVYLLAEPNVGYLTFATQAAAVHALTKQNGSTYTSNMNISVRASVPIKDWQ